MPDLIENRRNWAAWSGFLFALAAILCNVAFFAQVPGQQAVPSVSLVLAVVALVLLVIGLGRVFRQPRVFRGRIVSSILSLFTLLLAGMAVFIFVQARKLPRSSGAPQIGQRAPDFTLADTSGRPVSLDELFARSADSQSTPPKALLLIFYRGYW